MSAALHSEVEQITDAIRRGELDDWLAHLARCISDRQGRRNDGLEAGDEVLFSSETRPRYLIGVPATVQVAPRRGAKTVQVRLKSPVGRFSASGNIRVPMAWIQRKEEQ